MTRALAAILSSTLLLVPFARSQTAETEPQKDAAPVFRLGNFDHSSVEFATGTPRQPIHFVVGKSDPAKDWYQTQPAILASAIGTGVPESVDTSRKITFFLSSVSPGYKIHFALLVESASVPVLRVEINGKHGMFYLHPELDYSNGDQVDSFYPADSHADIEFPIPAGILRHGENTITLQAVEEADQKVPEAGITYDAIELDRQATKPATASSAEIRPTVFFERNEGGLQELVDAFIRHAGPLKIGEVVTLSVGGKKYEKQVRGTEDFGEQKLEFAVAEFSAKTEARLRWNLDGHPGHLEEAIDPKKKWTVFVVPHIHVDVGYSDYQGKVAAIQSRSIDEAMDMTDKHPDYRFSLDGEWDLEQFFRTRNTAQQQRAITAIQKEQLYLPAQYANLLTGFPTGETLIRSLYPSANFSRTHNAALNYANITDVPSYSWSYASILASAGIHDLAGGSNNYRAPVLIQGRLNESSPMWWVGPDGGKVLLWYSRIYQQMQMLFGLPPLLPAGRDTFPLFLQMYEHAGYRADATILYGTQVENTDLFPQQAELAGKWNALYAYPHLQYSGFHDALETIRQQFGDAIPTIRGDGGPYWEDGIISDAYYAAMERQTEGRAPTAEKLATLAGLVNPRVVPDKELLDRMWRNMVLMDEHTWDSYNSTTDSASLEATQQLAVKDQYAVNASAAADFLAKNNMESIVNSIPAGTGSLIVFNGLNWKRSGPVTVDLDKGKAVFDALTGKVIPAQLLSSGANYQRLRFDADEVPAVGYKIFQVKPAEKSPAPLETQQSTTLESPYYKVELDVETGAVRSIYDKQLQRELVNRQSPYRFGQYLYVSGGDKAPNSLLQYSRVYPEADLSVHPSGAGSLVSVERTPDGWVAHLHSHAENTPNVATEIWLSDKEKKIEFVEDLDKTAVLSREAAYFAFPFAMDGPQFQYEIQNGVVDPAKDMYAGAGHEWFSVQHWVSAQQDGLSATVMPLDAPLVTLGDINRGHWPEQFGKRNGTVFSYTMNNYWDTNYRAAQGGHFEFRYIVTSASRIDAPTLSHLGWEAMTPLEVDTVTTQDKAIPASPASDAVNSPQTATTSNAAAATTLDAHQQSFLHVSDPQILLQAWKTAEDGDGSILRFLDLGGDQRTVTVQIPLIHLQKVTQTDSIERNQRPLPVEGAHEFTFTIHRNEIVTVRIVGLSETQTLAN